MWSFKSISKASAAILGVLVTCLSTDAADATDADFFERRIRPLFHDHCIECHGPEKQKAGLRLDSREAVLKGGESGPTVRLDQPRESLLLQAIRHTNPDLKMPPAKSGPKLSEPAIADLESWVLAGVPWPAQNSTAAKSLSTADKAWDLEARKQRLPFIWKTPQRQSIPEISGKPGATDVDRFLFAKLAEKAIQPAAPADDRTWLRRVHVTLTGLPPSLDAIRAFLRDTSPQRRERVVDTLLASPHFGERWARHWLDLMRYAESRGHESDFHIANAWRYRDYVVRAFNQDVPYDRFVSEHIAGDVLPPRLEPNTSANESILATGWAFLGEEVHSPVDIRQDECERIDNKVDVLSKSFLGLTVACARCHDHKFDAITQKDYYALSGFILGSNFRQARFETMESHAQLAGEVERVRAKNKQPIASALGSSLRPALESLVPILVAARRVAQGESLETISAATSLQASAIKAWLKPLSHAATNGSHVLYSIASLILAPEPEMEARIAKGFHSPLMPGDREPTGEGVIADYTRSNATPWKTDGPGFGQRPLPAGFLVLGTATNPIERIMPYGAARKDPFWNRLTLTPGTEMDSGSLGSAGRSGKTLFTPKFTLASGKLQYLIRGKASVYAGVDSHIMVIGPLHGQLVAGFDTGNQLRWVTHNLTDYVGHRLHLEFAPSGDAELEVLKVVDSAEVPTWLPTTPWLPPEPVSSLRAAIEAFQKELLLAATDLTHLTEGQPMDSRQTALADWLIQNARWLSDAETASNAARPYVQALQSLERDIRWDSPTAVSWMDGTGVDDHVLIRGKPTKRGIIAHRGLPEAFGTPRIYHPESSGRVELARQLVHPDNPLVARVFVNRVWHHVFGHGIVPTVDNFGILGERPSHPELLDHLAWRFVHEQGWSLKRLLRHLVLTEAFARNSRAADSHAELVDPTNRLFHRMPVRRLEGEAIRDALLVVSGRFDPKLYGPPIPVHLTEFIVGRGRPEVSGPLDGAGRRSLYTSVRRNFLSTMMVAFDFPTPFSSVGKRNITNVPAQSLVMMNDPFVREQAGVWASRLLRELPDAEVPRRIDWLFETTFTRLPSPDERQIAQESMDQLSALHAGAPAFTVWSEFCHALLNANEFIYIP